MSDPAPDIGSGNRGLAAELERLTRQLRQGGFRVGGLFALLVSLVVIFSLLMPTTFPHVTTHLTADDLRPLVSSGIERLLLQTPNAALWEHTSFQTHYIALTESAAHLLVEMGVRLVGIDYLSVDAFARHDFPVHRILLGAGVLILEGLDLRAVPPGDYELLALPLLVQHGDGAPVRAILRRP